MRSSTNSARCARLAAAGPRLDLRQVLADGAPLASAPAAGEVDRRPPPLRHHDDRVHGQQRSPGPARRVRAAYALGRSEALPPSLPFATIVIERIFDGFTLLLFLVGGLSFLRPSRSLLWAAALMCVLYLGILAALVLLRTGRGLGLLIAIDWLPERLANRGGASSIHSVKDSTS